MKAFLIITISLTGALSICANEFKLLSTMYSSYRASKKGDLITVSISEQTTSKKEESISAAKESSLSAPAPSLGSSTGRTLSKALSGIDVPQSSFSGNSTFTGTGSMASEEQLITNMTVRVVDVLENDLLVIRGERKLKIKKETVTIVMTGLVRPQDVDSDNMVNSAHISDFSISYQSKGFVTRSSNPGWLSRVFTFINPY